MNKIILLSCLSLIPFSFAAHAMEPPLESGDGYLTKRDSVTAKPEELENMAPQTASSNAILTSEKIEVNPLEEHLRSMPSSDSFSLNMDNHLKKKPQPLNLEEVYALAENNYLTSEIPHKPKALEIKPEKIELPITTIHSSPIIQDATQKSESEESILPNYIVVSNKKTSEPQASTCNESNINIHQINATKGDLLNFSQTPEKKKMNKRGSSNKPALTRKQRSNLLSLSSAQNKAEIKAEETTFLKVHSVDAGSLLKDETNMKKSSSLNTQQTKKKTRERRFSLSLDSKKTPFFEKETKSSEKK